MTVNAAPKAVTLVPLVGGSLDSSQPLGPPDGGDALLFDGFESGDMSTTNPDGFAWQSMNATSIVTMKDDHPDHVGQMWPVVIWNGSAVNTAKATYADWYAKAGVNSLRFRYAAGANQSEQRFNLGAAYGDELWFKYWLRVPTNYSHPQVAPTNQKFFIVWCDAYDVGGDGSTVYFELLPDGTGGNSSIALTYTPGGGQPSGGFQQHTPLIAVPADRGRWMSLVYRIKFNSSPGAGDGIMQSWRKWDGEGEYVQLQSLTTANLNKPTSPPLGWNNGYLMGWANSPYAAETEFLIDDFTISLRSPI